MHQIPLPAVAGAIVIMNTIRIEEGHCFGSAGMQPENLKGISWVFQTALALFMLSLYPYRKYLSC